MIKSKKQSMIIVGAFVLVLMLFTTTYAFFNYTRTGSANIIKTGRISFNSEQGTSINLDNLFPIEPTETGIMNDATKVGTVTINVTGDTTYSDGIEYLVSAVNVENTVGNKQLPISIDVSVENNSGNNPATSLGTSDTNYFTNHGTSAGTSIYKVLANDTISEGDRLLVGYIKSGATGVDGNIVIKAYIDRNKIAISDTYPESTIRTVITTNYSSSNCETILTGVTGASTYCATTSSLQDAIDNEDLTSEQIALLVNGGIVEEYTNGTTSTWVGDREVFTTTEWNSLQVNGVSFQVKVEANEGTWVEEPIPTIESCPGCKFMYTTNEYYSGGSNNDNATQVSTLTGVAEDYTTLNKNIFIGFTESNGKVDRAFACGIKGENPNNGKAFCVERTINGTAHIANSTLLNTLYGPYDSGTGYGCIDVSDGVSCYGLVNSFSGLNGYANTANDDFGCYVDIDGMFSCYAL